MKVTRREIVGAFLLGGGIASAFGVSKIYHAYAEPNLDSLEESIPLINDLIDVIIPSTRDSVGARETEVASFIVYAIKNCIARQSQNNFLNGLEAAIGFAKKEFGKNVADCTVEEKIILLNYFEDNVTEPGTLLRKLKSRILGEEFIFTLKRLTIWGFCSSELGATKALNYDYMPSKFVGITKLLPGQKSWATS